MANDFGKEFLVKLGFDIDNAGLQKFISGISSASLRVAAMNVAVVSASAGIFAFVQGVAKEYRGISLLAQELKTTADAVDNFRDTLYVFGVENKEADDILRGFNRVVQDTNLGLGRAKKVFENLGISVKDANGKIRPTTDVLTELQGKIKGLGRGEQIRILERLGLGSGAGVLRLFNSDLSETQAALNEIDKAVGFSLDNTIKQSEDFQKSWRGLKEQVNLIKVAFSKIFDVVAVKLMPSFKRGIEQASKSFSAFFKGILESAPKIIDSVLPVIEVINRISTSFIKLGAFVFSVLGKIIGWIFKVNSATGGWIGYIVLAIAAWKLLNLAFLNSPIGRIVALGLLFVALADDLRVFLNGGKSFLDWSNLAVQVIGAIITGFATYRIALLASTALTAAWGVAVAIVNGVISTWAAVTKSATAVMWLLNVALSANPIGAILIGVAAFAAAAFLIVKNWEKVRDFFLPFFEKLGVYWDKLKGFFGGASVNLNANLPNSKGGAPLAPSLATTNSISNTNKKAEVNQTTNITVTGSTDPDRTAKEIGGLQGRVNGDMVRNFAGAAR